MISNAERPPDKTFTLPPLRTTETGAPRRIGVELEMGGMDIDGLSRLVAEHVRGTIEKISDYEHVVHGDPAGDWVIELDFAYLKEKGREDTEAESLLSGVRDAAEELLKVGAEQIVPLEVVSPPVVIEHLGDVERLISRLRDAGARGTKDGLIFAFGMQLNFELPSTDAETITRYLKAFLCLFDWLKAHAEVDLTRQLTTYAAPFPTAYVRKVVDPGYRPDLHTLIMDYLEMNPTRNRALDMLPLFAYLDEQRVRNVVDDPRIKARPALHYRLPNCEIDSEDWGIHLAWSDWLEVERLVADANRLNDLCVQYVEFLDKPIGRLLESWAEHLKCRLENQEDR